jgi:glucose-1-phosphate thymidylyltransferase
VVEKPPHPKSELAIIPIYVLPQRIFGILERLPQGGSSEIHFTQAINHLIKTGQTVQAFDTGEIRRIDIGSPDTYHDALSFSFKT